MRAVWLVGFRPFFLLAMVSGLALPALWALIFSGLLPAPLTSFSAVQWHAHEMFFGFGMAMLIGFLLTSSKNWVGIRGYHGRVLQLLVFLWLAERAGMWFEQLLPRTVFWLSNLAFPVLAAALIMGTLIRHRKSDSYYPDNVWFLLLLPLVPVAKVLLLDGGVTLLGQGMAIGLFRLAFLIMLERTLSQFMKGVFQVTVLRHPWLDQSIKGLAFLVVFAAALPAGLAAGLMLLLALLLAVRFAFWKPHLAFRRLDIGIMYLGYLAIVLHLVLAGLDLLAPLNLVGGVIPHVFTLGVIGLVTPAMIVRISKGHTGRKVAFEPADKACLWLMILGFALRIAAPQLWPGAYTAWVGLAALCWFIGFSLMAWRYAPFLLAPRIDGKEH